MKAKNAVFFVLNTFWKAKKWALVLYIFLNTIVFLSIFVNNLIFKGIIDSASGNQTILEDSMKHDLMWRAFNRINFQMKYYSNAIFNSLAQSIVLIFSVFIFFLASP